MAIKDTLPPLKPTLLLDFANTKALDPRVTFTRASTATYYDGKTTAKAEENLLLQSQAFDDANWGKFEITVTANAWAAPDGTSTADKAVPTTNTAVHWLAQVSGATTAGLTYTYSVFAKADGYGFAQITLSGNRFEDTGRKAVFNLSTGTFTAQTGVTAQAISVGGGWWRLAINAVAATTTSGGYAMGIVVSNSLTLDASFAGDGASGVLFWGAQFEQRSAVTAYTPTTTAPITNYIPALQTAPAGVPRFDHNPVTGESLGLLIEESRTNLLVRSGEFSDVAWAKVNVTVSGNVVVAPDGTLTGDKVTASSAVAGHQIAQSTGTLAAGSVHTASAFVKAGEYAFVQLIGNASNNNYGATFNLAAGTVVSFSNVVGTPTISSAGNGWWRVSVSFTPSASSGGYWYVQLMDNTQSASFAGDGTSGVYIWGAQLEAGAFATSYIPTAASAVTRAADSASMTGLNFSSWYNAKEGVIYHEGAFAAIVAGGTYGRGNSLVARFFKSGAPAYFNSINIGGYRNSGPSLPNWLDVSVCDSGAVVNAQSSPQAFNNPVGIGMKIAVSFDVSGFSQTLNGAIPASTQASTFGQTLCDSVSFTTDYTGATRCGWIKRLAYYPKRLTNAQLQSLTA